jgi:glutaredoxin-like YruB-family protein
MNRLLVIFLLCAAFVAWKHFAKPPPLTPAAIAAAATRQVTIYTTDWCGYCKKAKAYMKEQGIRYVEHDIEKDSAAYAEFKRRGGNGVPLIVVGDNSMSGFSADKLEQILTQ